MPIRTVALAAPVILLMLLTSVQTGFAAGREYRFRGKTMGTFYTVKFITSKKVSRELWQKKIDTRLKQVNKHLSMYDPESELSRFNRYPSGKPFAISKDFHAVLERARALHTLTRGAWDGTVKPLVDLWGFGTRDTPRSLPGKKEVANALERTGFAHLQLEDRHITKKIDGITLDLGSIAKGFGVDAVAGLLNASGLDRHLVEIGGELVASGVNKKKKPWAVGISRPDQKASRQGIYRVILLKDRAIATSGNYRNFFNIDGTTYSHIIDPQTGHPVSNRVVSASVTAEDCTFADGLATALMVMEIKEGLKLVNRLDHVECLVIEKKGATLIPHASNGFEALVRQ